MQHLIGTTVEKLISQSDINKDNSSFIYSWNFQLILSEILSTNWVLESIENKSLMLDYIISTNWIEKSHEEYHIISILKTILKDYEYLYNLYESWIINIFDIICFGMTQEKKISFIKDNKYLYLLKDVIKKCKLPFVIEDEKTKLVSSKSYDNNSLNSVNYQCIKTFQVNNKYYNIYWLDINEIVWKLYNIIMNLNWATTPKDALQILFAEINKLIPVDRISFAQITKWENIELSSVWDFCSSYRPNPIGETSKRTLNEQSILFRAISNWEIIITNDIQSWAIDKFVSKWVEIPRFTAEIMKAWYKSVMIIPIIDKWNPLGILFLNSNSKDKFSQFDIEKIQNISWTLVFWVTNIIKMKIMQEVSLRDQLTQLYNRTYLEKWINEYTIIQKKKFESWIEHSWVFIHMDLDHFKQVNDTYWHDAWDEVLRQVSKTITNTLRAQDMVIRTWWEEILIYLDWCDIKWWIAAMKRLQRAINMIKIKHKWHNVENISISWWIVWFSNWVWNCDKYDIEIAKNMISEIINITDKLLYISKRERKCYTRLNISIDLPNPHWKYIKIGGINENLTDIVKENYSTFKIDQKTHLNFWDLITREQDEDPNINKTFDDYLIIENKLRSFFPSSPNEKIKEVSRKFKLVSYQDWQKIIEHWKPLSKFIMSHNWTVKIQYTTKENDMILECWILKYWECSRISNNLTWNSDYEYVAVWFSDVWEIEINEIIGLL